MTLTDFLSRLDGRKKCGGYYMAKCPAHGDEHQSLSIREEDGMILVNCHAGCSAEAIVGAISLVTVEVFPNLLIQIFGAANESVYYTDFAIKTFRTYLCVMILACVNKATFIFLQAMGKAALSTMLSMVREIVFGVGFALLLPMFFGLDGVLYSMPVSDILTAVISGIVIVSTYKQLSKSEDTP